MALDAKLEGVEQAEVEQAAQRQVVRPLLRVRREREQARVGLPREKLERRLATGLERARAFVAAREARRVALFLLVWFGLEGGGCGVWFVSGIVMMCKG